MPRRSESFDAVIAEEMKDLEFAKGFLLSGVSNGGETTEEALKRTIECMGIAEFSKLADAQVQNISAFIRGERNLSRKVLDKYLSVFGLKTKIIVVENDDVA